MGGYVLPGETEERQVLETCLHGADRDGLELLYRRYAPALTAFCERRLVGGGMAGDAEDAVHETILKAYRALPGFREGARLWPWLATIAANVCTDMVRSRERLESSSALADEAGETGSARGCSLLAPEVDEDVSRRLRASIVESALDELPERFRTPLFLREFMGWSYEEIATFSNKSIASVRTTLMRARRAFQSRVEDVARRRGQWPLPVVVVDGWRRLRSTLRSWRAGVARAGGDAAGAFLRAEGMLGGLGSGLQAAAVALVAAGTLTSTGAVAVMQFGGVQQLEPIASQVGLTMSTGAVGAVGNGSSGRPSASAPAGAESAMLSHDTSKVADAPAGATTHVDRDDDYLTIEVAHVVPRAPVGPSFGGVSDAHVPCNPDTHWHHACDAYDMVPQEG